VGYDWKTELPGVVSHHADSCPVRDGGLCTCGPLGFRASVRDWQSNQRSVSPIFRTIAQAVDWQRVPLTAPTGAGSKVKPQRELGPLIDAYLDDAEHCLAPNERGMPYTRDEMRSLRAAMSYVDLELGSMSIEDVRRRHVQALLDQLRASGVPQARISLVLDGLRSFYAYAIRREIVGFSPLVEIELPDQSPVPPTPASSNGASRDWMPPDPTPTPQEVSNVGPPWTPPPFPGPPEPTSPPFPDGAAAPQPTPQQPPPGSFPSTYPTPQPTLSGAYPTPQPPSPPAFSSPYPTPEPTAPYTYPAPEPTPPQPFPSAYPTPQPPTYTYPTWYPPQPQHGRTSSALSAIIGSPGPADADYDSTMQERWLWWTVRIIVIVFVLIALVLVAESV
jgi:hypothetical protein